MGALISPGQFGHAVRCSELQGKYLKMFSDRIEHVETIDQIGSEQLIDLLREIMESGEIDLLEILNTGGFGHELQ